MGYILMVSNIIGFSLVWGLHWIWFYNPEKLTTILTLKSVKIVDKNISYNDATGVKIST